MESAYYIEGEVALEDTLSTALPLKRFDLFYLLLGQTRRTRFLKGPLNMLVGTERVRL